MVKSKARYRAKVHGTSILVMELRTTSSKVISSPYNLAIFLLIESKRSGKYRYDRNIYS